MLHSLGRVSLGHAKPADGPPQAGFSEARNLRGVLEVSAAKDWHTGRACVRLQRDGEFRTIRTALTNCSA